MALIVVVALVVVERFERKSLRVEMRVVRGGEWSESGRRSELRAGSRWRGYLKEICEKYFGSLHSET